MTELNMYPTRSFVRIKATYTNIITSGGVSYAPFHHFVLLKKYIVYGQGPIAWICMGKFIRMNRVKQLLNGLAIDQLVKCYMKHL